jgi:hypothetical protein
LCPELKAGFANFRLCIATTAMSDPASFFLSERIVFVISSVGLTYFLFLAETPDKFKALFAIANGKSES